MPNSTNMNLPVPVVGTTVGPTWASNYNSCMTIIDAHDHTTGNGVSITPSGININSTLSFNSHAASDLLKAVFTSQTSALTGTNFLSFVGGNLYVNDGSGNQVQMTSGGGVAGTPGSIGSLSAPASATYSSGSTTFLWKSDSTKSAAMDNGAVTIRETNVASAKGITLASPSSLAADYQLTLPTGLPGTTQAVNLDASGNVGTVTYDAIGQGMTATGANAIAATMTSTGANAIAADVTSVAGGNAVLAASSVLWQSWTPTLSIASGFITSFSINEAKYMPIGSNADAANDRGIVFFFIDFDVGMSTGNSSLNFTLPFNTFDGPMILGNAVVGAASIYVWTPATSGGNASLSTFAGNLPTAVTKYIASGFFIQET